MIVVLSIAVCAGVYWDGLYGPLLLDDISNLGGILKPDFGPADILPNILSDSGILKRPVSMLSFILNGLSGASLFHWKLTNLVIHLVNGLLLYALTTRLIQATGITSKIIPAIVAAAWILHPLQVSTVLYTVQRMTELSTLFVFAAMLTYTIARERQQAGSSSWHLQAITWLLLFPLGLLSKENALLLPAFIFLIEAFILSRNKLDNRQLLIIIMATAIFFIIAIVIKGDWLLNAYVYRDFTLSERLLTEGRILVAYIGMLLIPAQNRMGFAHDDIILSHGLFDPWTTLPAILLISILITIAFLCRKKYPLIGFGILFFFIGHSMESTIIPLELMYEHRNYLPSFGIFLAATSAVSLIANNRIAMTTFVILLFSLATFVTYNRTQTWSSSETLYFYMEKVHPRSERLATIKATQLTNTGNYALARKRLAEFSSLGSIFQRLNIDCSENSELKDWQLRSLVDESSQANNYAIVQLINLANSGIDNKCRFSSAAFMSLLDQVATLPTISGNNRQILAMYKAHYLKKSNKPQEAIKSLHSAFLINEKNPTPLFLACEWMLDIDRHSEAEKTCNQAFKVVKKSTFGKYDKLSAKVMERLKAEKRPKTHAVPVNTSQEIRHIP